MSASAPEMKKGPFSGMNVIGDVTEAIQSFLTDRWNEAGDPPRFEEDLSFVPKDRQEVFYSYMYKVSRNENLLNRKRWRIAPIFTETFDQHDNPEREVYYHRPPMCLDLFYLVSCHAKHRSDAERLLGWLLLTLNDATHLIYRPRKFLLPDGRAVDSLARPYDENATDGDERLFMEKVSLALVNDLTTGDGIHLFSSLDAPFRPFLTYRARVALDGPLVASAGGTVIRMNRLQSAEQPETGARTSPSGRPLASGHQPERRDNPGPQGHRVKRDFEPSED